VSICQFKFLSKHLEKTSLASLVQVKGRSTVKDRQPRSFCRRTCCESVEWLACGPT